MNRLEMAHKLFEFPDDIAREKLGSIVYAEYNSDGVITLYWQKSRNEVSLQYYPNEVWEIIEPKKKLKEFDFGEAYHIYYSESSQPKIKSCVSGKIYDDEDMGEQTLEELKGKWTVEGYYED